MSRPEPCSPPIGCASSAERDCIGTAWVDALPYLQRVPLLSNIIVYDAHSGDDAKATSGSTIRRLLGGLTNVNYLIERSPGDRYVLRVPGVGTAEYINRRNEKICAQMTSAILVNAPVLFFDEADGLMLTRYLEGSVTMSAALFSSDLSSVGRAGQVLRRLHRNAGPFPSDFKLFTTIDDYERLLLSKTGQTSLPDGYHVLRDSVEGLRGVLQQLSIAHVPSHCDPLCENFLDVGDRMFLIDFEYCGNNDPMWDPADLSVEGGFTPEQDRALLAAYLDLPTDAEHQLEHSCDYARFVLFKALVDFLWTLWGLLQHVNGNSAEDFWSYSLRRFHRCRQLMLSDLFKAQVDVLRALTCCDDT